MTKFFFEYQFVARQEIEADTAEQARVKAETHAVDIARRCNLCALAFDEPIKFQNVFHTGGIVE